MRNVRGSTESAALGDQSAWTPAPETPREEIVDDAASGAYRDQRNVPAAARAKCESGDHDASSQTSVNRRLPGNFWDWPRRSTNASAVATDGSRSSEKR